MAWMVLPRLAKTGRDVAGWELYDGVRKSGTLLLGINDRVGVLIEAGNIFPHTFWRSEAGWISRSSIAL